MYLKTFLTHFFNYRITVKTEDKSETSFKSVSQSFVNASTSDRITISTDTAKETESKNGGSGDINVAVSSLKMSQL